MTEQEAIGVMMTEKHCVERNIKHECDRDCVKCDLLMKDNDVLNGYDMAIKSLEEVQQYREIGTPEKCRENKEFLEFLYNRINPNDMEQYLSIYHGSGEKIN